MYVNMHHVASLKGQFLKIKMYTQSESCINKHSADVWFVRIEQYLTEIQPCKYRESGVWSKSPLKLSKWIS